MVIRGAANGMDGKWNGEYKTERDGGNGMSRKWNGEYETEIQREWNRDLGRKRFKREQNGWDWSQQRIWKIWSKGIPVFRSKERRTEMEMGNTREMEEMEQNYVETKTDGTGNRD